MPRPRKAGNKDLPNGLYAPGQKGCFRMRHPLTNKKLSLKTKDKKLALERYWMIMQRYRPQLEELLADKFVSHTGPRARDTSKEYRLNILPAAATRKGVPLSPSTINTYQNFLLDFEAHAVSNTPIGIFSHPEQGPLLLRSYLKAWLEKPKTYNYRLSCLSRLFKHAVDSGLLQRNPCKDIDSRGSKGRDVYMNDDDYLTITDKLATDFHEVYARCCDWLYLMSGRPTNMLEVQEEQITEAGISYFATKNKQLVLVEMDEELAQLIGWFRDYKKKERIVSPYLIVHPQSARRGLATKPISTENLYRYFKRAAAVANLDHYTLRDIRPKALTDEAELAGQPTNKGAHVTEQMRKHYVKRILPIRVSNNLKTLRKSKNGK